jgi:surface antigen
MQCARRPAEHVALGAATRAVRKQAVAGKGSARRVRRVAARRRPSRQDEIMRNILGIGTALVAGFGCAAPVASQTAAYDAQPPEAAPCRDIAGQAEIDGVMQPIVGRACLQPDGTWRIAQDSGAVVAAPVLAYPYYGPWYWGPWYWGPPVVGVGASFVFVDRFHHFHHRDHDRFGRPDRGLPGLGGGFRGPGTVHDPGGMHGFGGMHGAGGMPGGGFRRH